MSGTGAVRPVAVFFLVALLGPLCTSRAEASGDPIRRSLRDCPLPEGIGERLERERWSDDTLVDTLKTWRAARPSRFGPTVPPEASVQLVPDFAPMQTLHIVTSGWPIDDDLFVTMARTASLHGQVQAAVMSPADLPRVRKRLEATGARMDRITFAASPLVETVWIRDFGPVPVNTPVGPGVLDFGYAIDCNENDAYPTTVAARGDRVWRSELVVDGGNLMTDGRGSCFTTTALLDANDLDRDSLSAALREWAGCTRTVVLEPLQGNVIQHVDMFLTPAPDGVLLLAAFDPEEDPVNHAVMAANRQLLASAKGAPGWTLVDLPVPRPLLSTTPEIRTWNNLLPFNGTVLVPDYRGTADTRRDQAWATIEAAFPDRTLVAVPSDNAIAAGGAVHCRGRATP